MSSSLSHLFRVWFLLLAIPLMSIQGQAGDKPTPSTESLLELTWTLEECINEALENNRQRPISQYSIRIAEAQHRQALSGYWPQVDLMGSYNRLDEAPNFQFPTSSITVAPGSTAITVPPGVLGPGPVSLPISTPAQTFQVPTQDFRLTDRDSYISTITATWLLYDGGMRNGLATQAKAGIDVAKERARRTDLEIVESVKRFYYGAILTQQIHQIGKNTLTRMETTLRLTESMYKEGSGTVKKTDFLSTKVMVETLRSTLALLEKNESITKSALAITMGESWNSSITPRPNSIPYQPKAANLETLVNAAYQFNPDWSALEAGIRAYSGALKNARSGYHPKIALTGEVHRWWNQAEQGLATRQNRDGWSVGVGVSIPLFNGMLTKNRVKASQARLEKIRTQKLLLKDALGLQIKDLFLSMAATTKQHEATRVAMETSIENRDLNTRAYQNELVETEDVIRAQLVEAFMKAQHFKMRYDYVALQARLDLVVGTEVLNQLGILTPATQ